MRLQMKYPPATHAVYQMKTGAVDFENVPKLYIMFQKKKKVVHHEKKNN